MTCDDCIHKPVCYRTDSVSPSYADKCGDFALEKTGHWIDGKCNRCGTHAPYWAMATTYYCSEYCPNCGAKMESEETE